MSAKIALKIKWKSRTINNKRENKYKPKGQYFCLKIIAIENQEDTKYNI